MVGALTDQCVESAIRDACDDNFLVTQVRTVAETKRDQVNRAVSFQWRLQFTLIAASGSIPVPLCR